MPATIKVLPPDNSVVTGTVQLPASKSISNRALIIQALSQEKVELTNVSTAQDSIVLNSILNSYTSNPGDGTFDVGHAGTAMRFLTAYFALQQGVQLLTGSERMQKRPVGPLVEALRSLGAEIRYAGNHGYPPLEIGEGRISGGAVQIDGGISSQFISALMMIGPELPEGIIIKWKETLVSRPYMEMTSEIMKNFGASVTVDAHSIKINPIPYHSTTFHIEPDWSAAGYWLEMAALSQNCDITIPGLMASGLQSDAVAVDIFQSFGVDSHFEREGLKIKKCDMSDGFNRQLLKVDCTGFPDLAQTLAFTAAGFGIPIKLSGLQTLRIKETDRLAAIQNELLAFDLNINTGADHLVIQQSQLSPPIRKLRTYNDHRMAMVEAPLSLKTGALCIEDPNVVQKSYPGFWTDLEKCGFRCCLYD